MIRQPNLLYLIFSFLLLSGVQALSQTITISSPTIGFTQACASPSFNTYNFSFSFFPPQNLGPGNQFLVELSDSNGSFAAPTVVQTLTNTTSPVSGSFNLPTDTYGEGYKIRVRSTNPPKTSGASVAFAAYYAIHNQPFSINNNAGTIQICEDETVTLQIDNDGTPASPLYYPSLNYIWYKDFIEIPGETGPSITVSESGSYYVITDYGTCVLNSYSNIVQVEVMETLAPSISADSGQTQICPGNTVALSSSIQDGNYGYTWYKDEAPIAGANAPVYEASEEGMYHLEVANGPCIFETYAIALEVNDYNLSLDPASTTVIIPGENITLTAITDAENPAFQWYKDGEIITDADQETFEAEQDGGYKVVVTQATPCSIIKESEISIAYPDAFTLSIGASAEYTECSSESTTLSITQFEASTPEGTVNLINNTFNYTYQWLKDGIAVTNGTNTSLALNESLDNGSYILEITIPGYGQVVSNAVTINLPIEEITITTDSELCEGGDVLLSSSITDSFYTYQWYKNGTPITGAELPAFIADAEGNYYLEVTGGACSTQSNSIILEIGEVTVTPTTPITDIILPGEEKILSVTTDAVSPAFAWTRNGEPLAETTATLTADEDGEYIVIATQTAGCVTTAQTGFTLEYPAGFDLAINVDATYAACVSGTATLSVASLTAITPGGPLDASAMGYPYQWYKDNTPVVGANLASLTLNSAVQNGNYKLGVTIPEFGEIFSNDIIIDLPVEEVSITNDTELCEGSNVLLSSSVTNSAYSYQWYKNGNPVAGANTPDLTTDTEGDYYLVVTSVNCSGQSNTITLTIDAITVTAATPLTDIILPGEEKTLSVTTDAQSPTYTWQKNGLPLAETSASLTADQDGEYTVTVTQTQGCNDTAQAVFTLEYPTGFTLTINTQAGYTACTSTTANLSITSLTAATPEGAIDASVMNYPYQWYKDDVAIPGGNTPALMLNSASQNGIYKLGVTIPGFGEIMSNTITINLPLGNIAITNSNGLCEGSTVLLTSLITDASYTYQWYKNNFAITGAYDAVFTADSEGIYHLVVTGGGCSSQSNSIALEIDEITVTPATSLTDVILPGEERILTVTTDAQSPIFSWSRNGEPLTETSASLTAVEDGEYTVTVTQTQGCNATEEAEFTLEYPSGFNLTISADAAYEACESAMTTLTATTLTAITPGGTIDALTMGYPYQWYKNDIPVTGATTASLLLDSAVQNGTYKLGVTIPQFGEIFSNAIIINLAIGSVEITSSNVMCEGTEVVLSSNVANAAYTYQWYKGGTPLAGATAPAFTANTEGQYYLVVTSGGCSAQSNTITLAIDEITVTATTIPAADIILPGEEKVLSVTTDAQSPVFTWSRDGETLAGTSASFTAVEDGEYVVEVTQTEGCNATGQVSFLLQYPSGFVLSIGTNAAYEACNSATATLSVTSFTATTPEGDIDAASMDYPYQWYKNDMPVSGTEASTLALNNASQNGIYKLGVTIPGFGEVFSNTITVNISIGTVEIIASGTLCPADPTVTVTGNITNSSYTYTWYHNGTLLASGNNPGITATETGEYFVTVNTGECLVTSNTITIEETDFELTSSNPVSDIIINGQTKEITVVTDALTPQYTWYRNGEAVPGASGSTLYATLDGEYKVVVTQTEGCDMSKELVFTLVYPSAYEVAITAGDYEPCVSTQAQLTIASFNAITPNGPVSITGGSYDYQWYYNNESVTGAISTALSVAEGGAYYLEISIPDFGTIISNVIQISPGIPETFSISTDDLFCAEGSTVTFTGNLTGEMYSYEWYKEGISEPVGNGTTFTVNESGSYYAIISYGECSSTSNTIELIPFNPDTVVIDAGNELGLLEGTSAIVTASGAETYTWYLNGNIIGNGPSIEITEPGKYSVIAVVGECEIEKHLIITIVENNIMAIPNVVTPNNDGINDTWSLPLKYMNSSEIEVVIYGPDGSIVFRSSNYMNNWPESGFTFSQKNPVYYYTIMEKREITKRGSITIITN